MITPFFILAAMNLAPNTAAAQQTITATVNKQMAQETAASMAAPQAAGGAPGGVISQEMMMIAPNDRASDFVQAYALLKQYNVASSIAVMMKDKTMIANIVDMQVMKNGTLIIFKMSTLQGEKYQLVKTEDIDSLVVS